MRPPDYPRSIHTIRADALFASTLQRSDQPSAAQVHQAIASAVAAFGIRGWELVVTDAHEDLIAKHKHRIAGVHAIGAGRFSLELPASAPPDALLAELTAAGARLVSLNPMRETLEDFFVEKVLQGPGQPK